MEKTIELRSVTKSYRQKKFSQVVLNNLNFCALNGQSIAIKGKSGSGKSTLLNIISATQSIDSGEVLFKNQNILKLSKKSQALYRSSNIGYIPQNLYLLDDRNVFNNIALPLQYMKLTKLEIKDRVESIAQSLGINTLLSKRIPLLSGGERQRVAICRAIVKDPLILLADEPTGSLDEENESIILDLFYNLKKAGTTVIIATHDDTVSARCDITYKLVNGTLMEDTKLAHLSTH